MKAILSADAARRAVFFMIAAVTVLPLIYFPIVSNNYHQLTNTPSIEDGVLDLEGYQFTGRPDLLLDGVWEFYADRWIISEPCDVEEQAFMARVPAPWNTYGGALPVRGRGSYRIMLENCPPVSDLLVYIPNISACYRTYLNGELVSGRQHSDGADSSGKGDTRFRLMLEGTSGTVQGDIELVVELESPDIGGLYHTPVLARHHDIYVNRGVRNLIAAACVGILLVSILCIVCFMLFRDKRLYSAALIAMDILVCMRFLAKDEFFEVIRNVLPGFGYYVVNTGLRISTFFLPVIFLFCVKQLFHIRIRKKMVILTGLYELLLTPLLIVCAVYGLARLQFFICLAGYLPFNYVGYCLYREVERRNTYSLLVSASFLFIMGSVISASLNDSGLLIVSISLFSPICFVIAVLLQLALYVRHNLELQQQAAEAENLRLRLKESETSLMLSQIQPHFLYNTLTAIHTMCLEEPETAADTTMKFAVFLRTNMRFIRETGLIPFGRELEHIRNYADIEIVRFKGRLTVHYEIGSDCFRIPALTIQPLVENAIHHGTSRKLEGGSVTLRTYETWDAYCVDVTDDGVGFDTSVLNSLPEDSYGISNITFRLREQAGAEIRFESAPGSGTAVHITIPKGGAADADGDH